jgi:peptidoglycan/LPS O-acetylase OafA/YrhL
MNSPEVASQKPAPIRALISLRFIAAILVVLFHYGGLIEYPPVFSQLISNGPARVNFFFVLSGFILCYNYYGWFEGSTSRFGEFAKARFARVYPMYLVALLIMTVVEIYFSQNPHHVLPAYNADVGLEAAMMDHKFSTGFGPLEVSLSWLASIFLVQALIPTYTFQQLWDVPAWSISAEAFFYICFPFFLRFVLSRFTHLRSLLRLFGVLFALQITAFGIVIGIFYLNRGAISATMDFGDTLGWIVYRSPFLRVWEFLIGCTLGALLLHHRKSLNTSRLGRIFTDERLRNATLGVTLAAILAVTFALSPNGFIGYAKTYLVYTPLFVVLIATLAFGKTFITKVLEHPWLVLLGEASYSLYLIHWIPYTILKRDAQAGHPVEVWICVVAIAATVIASMGFYKLVEVPARRAVRSWSFPRLVPRSVPNLLPKEERREV